MSIFHFVGCVISCKPMTSALEDCFEWARRYGAKTLASQDGQGLFVQFDATDPQLILFACRTAHSVSPPMLRFGFASAVKEAGGVGREARVGERSILQACDLASVAQPGQVLLSSQLGSLLQLAEFAPHARLRPTRVGFPDGRMGSAYQVEPHGAVPTGAA
jgi:hypothetical protein